MREGTVSQVAVCYPRVTLLPLCLSSLHPLTLLPSCYPILVPLCPPTLATSCSSALVPSSPCAPLSLRPLINAPWTVRGQPRTHLWTCLQLLMQTCLQPSTEETGAVFRYPLSVCPNGTLTPRRRTKSDMLDFRNSLDFRYPLTIPMIGRNIDNWQEFM